MVVAIFTLEAFHPFFRRPRRKDSNCEQTPTSAQPILIPENSMVQTSVGFIPILHLLIPGASSPASRARIPHRHHTTSTSTSSTYPPKFSTRIYLHVAEPRTHSAPQPKNLHRKSVASINNTEEPFTHPEPGKHKPWKARPTL